MTMTHQVPDSVEQIRPVQMMAVGNQAQIPVPFIRVTACGLLTIETVTEIVSTDPPLARYVSLTPEQLRGRGTAPALLLLKLLLSRPERFALRDWLMEQFCRDRELFSSVRIDNIVSQLRSLLCPPAYEPLRTHLVAHSRSSSSSGDGYQLASYPLIWTDLDALTWNVEQAARMERFGDDPLPYWERAYALAKRGIFLPDEMYSDWAAARCGEVAGVLRQSVQALARLYLARHGETGEEEALLLLRSYWQEHPQEEDVLRPLMELLGQRECYQEALEYYAKLETILSEEGEEPDARTQDLAEYIRTKQIQRRNPAPSRPLHELATRTRIVEANKMAVEESAPSLLPSSTRTQRGSNFGSHFMLTDEGGEALSSGRIFAQKEMLVGSEKEDKEFFPQIWTVPHLRNPFFTGREDLLNRLHNALHADKPTVAVTQHALRGLGGIGKTQVALEYAYRYRDMYRAIFWMKADTYENLLADFLALAPILQLPEQHAQNHAVTIAAVKHWLRTHDNWLLILDNADDLSLLREFLPSGQRGHILFTTRAQALGGLAYHIDVEEMTLETGAMFLLRRAGFLPSDASISKIAEAEYQLAQMLVQELGGLPLALDQAGAYMEETSSSLQEYSQLYHTHRSALLQRRGGLATDHPEAVATTWSLAFRQIEQSNPMAADLLRLCAFLDPDAIPEEVLLAGIQRAVPLEEESGQLRLDEAVGMLLRFSLVRRNRETRMLTIHRLVQAVLQDTMDQEQQTEWATHMIDALTQLFPKEITVENWFQCQRLLPHVQLLVAHDAWQKASLPEISVLCNQAGYYLREQALYREAEAFYRKGLAIREQLFGSFHPDTAQICYNLARLYFDVGQYVQSIQFHQRALAIRECTLPAGDLALALSLNSLAFTYYTLGIESEKVEQLFLRALPIYEQAVGLDHPISSHCLSNLALFYASQDRFAEAERLLLQVQAIREKHLPAVHLDTARSLQNLAWLYINQRKQERYEQAKRLLEQSLHIRQICLGPEHPQIATSLHNLAMLYEVQEKYLEAEQLYRQVLTIRRKTMGKDNPKVLLTEKHYADLLRKMGRPEEATSLELHIQEVQHLDMLSGKEAL